MAMLTDPVTLLKGVGPTKARQLAQLNIYTLEDLICHFPRGYEDRTQLVEICRLEVGKPACFRATVMSAPRTNRIRQGLEVTKVRVGDHTGRLTLTFFNRKFTADQLQYGLEYVFFGTLEGDYAGYGMTSPSFEAPESEPLVTRRVLPIYPLTAGLSNATLLRAVQQALSLCDPPAEILPEALRRQYGILPAEQAYRAIHLPASLEEAEQAKRRLIFEEFFLFSAGLSLIRATRAGIRTEPLKETDLTPFLQALPFTLTDAQKRAIGEIREDLTRGAPMNRLLQGDVGSGKTAVAAAAAYLCIRGGRQAALMAPTEILAEQHRNSLSRLLEPLGIRTELLTGSMTPKQKRQAREAIAGGEARLIIGTHALLSDATVFRDLGLVIADEQHRFGVAQRAALAEKGRDPHLLVMSATPIPRTLALLLYGDLELSVLDQLPPGRETVDTFLVSESLRSRINGFIRKQVSLGHQCYVVCPAVEETGSWTSNPPRSGRIPCSGPFFPTCGSA